MNKTNMKKLLFSLLLIVGIIPLCFSQDYFYENYGPFDPTIPSPAEFLGYNIGDYHTRHDLIVAYMEKLDQVSDRAALIDYGKSHELRRLVILQVSTEENINKLKEHRLEHLKLTDPKSTVDYSAMNEVPVFVNLGYNVHGNEPSSAEAAMLTAYVLVASNHPEITTFRTESVVFIDPTINPDGRDRHTQWANSHRSSVLVKDPMDSEHNEMWPRGRTNHYWFDLNRDWLLAVHPESQGKLNWYHEWYPNVVTDFHEMGSNSTYFFEPMKTNGSKEPIMPVENYTTLNDLFAKYYHRDMDSLGTLYFTKEVFDGTYPGYGSSYPDIQGGLGILFEQAGSRGHISETDYGELTFAHTIRNQFVNSLGTVEAAVENKEVLHKYQHDFFKSALANAQKSSIKGYLFGENYDDGRRKAFLKMLLRHKIEVHSIEEGVTIKGKKYNPGNAFFVPTAQTQYRMVQTMFETYKEYQDSVFYDASAWSLANAYNMKYEAVKSNPNTTEKLTMDVLQSHVASVTPATYAYLIPWDDYYAATALYALLDKKVRVMVSQKEYVLPTQQGDKSFSYGTLVIPVHRQEIDQSKLFSIVQSIQEKAKVDIYSTNSGFSISGKDLGSRYNDVLEKPKVALLIGEGVSGYEAGFVWHLLDQRVKMPLTKIRMSNFSNADLSKYNTLVMVSAWRSSLDSNDVNKIKEWTSKGNTLITIGSATRWAISNKLVQESLVTEEKKDKKGAKKEPVKRQPYGEASEIRGINSVGGAIFAVEIDRTHPIGFGYRDEVIPVYKNNTIWLAPSKNEFSTIAQYTDDPHIDGFITDKNLNTFLKKSAVVVASKVGSGRAILFANDPNFRGTWFGTNKMFLNALFFGKVVRIP
jgi:hypothetical protein